MESKDIIDGSKLIAEYLGWKYIGFNDLQGFPKAGWWKDQSSLRYYPKSGRVKIENGTAIYVCRKHDQLRFYNSLDALLPVIKKLESEGLGEFCYQWECEGETRNNFMNISFTLWNGGCYSEIEWELDPPSGISTHLDMEKTWIQNTFNCVVETIKYVEQLKTKKDE